MTTPIAAKPIATGPTGVFILGGQVRAAGSTDSLKPFREHLGSLLQVQNLVILIGSGASFHLGSPQVRNLSNEAVEKLVAASGAALSALEIKALEGLNPGNSGDMEGLLDRLQTAVAYSEKLGQDPVRLGAEDVSLSDVISLREKLNRSLAHACALPGPGCLLPDPLSAHRTFLTRLARARRANLPRAKIFTTNYDLVIEKALDELGFPYIDGFSGTVDRRLNVSYYGLDMHRIDATSQRVIERSESSFYLHKVHGSLNWRAHTTSDGLASIETTEVRQVPLGDANAETALIYPTASKEGDTLAYPYADLLRLLTATLQLPDTAVLSVGYGFKDDHINRILLTSLGMNSGMHLTAVDPFGVLGDATIEELAVPGDHRSQYVPEADPGEDISPIGRLARVKDSRIAVFTGEQAKFSDFANLLPDPGIQQVAPAGLAAVMSMLAANPVASGTTTEEQGS